MNNQFPPIDWYARPDSWTYRMPGFSPLPGSWKVPTPPLAAARFGDQSDPTDPSRLVPPVAASSGNSPNRLSHRQVPRLGTRLFSCRGS